MAHVLFPIEKDSTAVYLSNALSFARTQKDGDSQYTSKLIK
jgi:hypothetical protein